VLLVADTLLRIHELADEIEQRRTELDEHILQAVMLGASIRCVADAARMSRSKVHRRLVARRPPVAELEPGELDALIADGLKAVERWTAPTPELVTAGSLPPGAIACFQGSWGVIRRAEHGVGLDTWIGDPVVLDADDMVERDRQDR
jgi:hypothetical protein